MSHANVERTPELEAAIAEILGVQNSDATHENPLFWRIDDTDEDDEITQDDHPADVALAEVARNMARLEPMLSAMILIFRNAHPNPDLRSLPSPMTMLGYFRTMRAIVRDVYCALDRYTTSDYPEADHAKG
jgi:hypothetical protein